MQLTITVTLAEDVRNTWISHCLDFDIMSTGSNPTHALRMLAEAIDIVVRDEASRNIDAFTHPSPPEDWKQVEELMAARRAATPAIRDYPVQPSADKT